MWSNFNKMNQQKYIMFAILLLLVGGLIYLGFKKLPQGKCVENLSTNIDSEEPLDNSNESKLDGKRFFISKCASCHSVIKNTVGPALSGLNDRGPWNDSKKLYNYIRKSESLDGNRYIDSLRKVFGSKHMAFPDLSDEEISAILKYINLEYRKPIVD